MVKKIFIFKDMDNKYYNFSKISEKLKKLLPVKRDIKNFISENFELDINHIQFNTNSKYSKNKKINILETNSFQIIVLIKNSV